MNLKKIIQLLIIVVLILSALLGLTYITISYVLNKQVIQRSIILSEWKIVSKKYTTLTGSPFLGHSNDTNMASLLQFSPNSNYYLRFFDDGQIKIIYDSGLYDLNTENCTIAFLATCYLEMGSDLRMEEYYEGTFDLKGDSLVLNLIGAEKWNNSKYMKAREKLTTKHKLTITLERGKTL